MRKVLASSVPRLFSVMLSKVSFTPSAAAAAPFAWPLVSLGRLKVLKAENTPTFSDGKPRPMLPIVTLPPPMDLAAAISRTPLPTRVSFFSPISFASLEMVKMA